MRYPAFIRELTDLPNRRRLLVGVYAGYAVALAFLAIAFVADQLALVATTRALYSLVGFKLATNTLAWVAVRRGRFAIGALALNLAADLVALTGAIYLTGAQLSPLHAVYVIQIAVVGVLFNHGVMILVAVGSVAMYGTMSLLVLSRALPTYPPPVSFTGGVTGPYVVIDFATWAMLLGGLTYYLSVVLRVLREKEHALERHALALVEAGQHKQQFMTNVTHELRSPIHGVLGLSELLRSDVYGALTDKQREAIGGIEDSATGLLRLVDDLLELARADAGRLVVKPVAFQLGALLEESVASARWQQGRKELAIALEFAPDLPELWADRTKLGHVIGNLLSNAIKFTPEGGRIAVRARRSGARGVQIDVEDTGIGIPPDDLLHVFEPFRQVDGTSSRRFGGAGLGLAVVARLTESLGGDVSVRSEPQRGTHFSVHLPNASKDNT